MTLASLASGNIVLLGLLGSLAAGLMTSVGALPVLFGRLPSERARDILLGFANFLYSDGDALFAHGHRRKQAGSSRATAPGLWLLRRWCQEGEHGFVADGVAVDGADQRIALLASVPLSNEPWLALGEGEVVAVSNGQLLTCCPAGSAASAPNASSGARP